MLKGIALIKPTPLKPNDSVAIIAPSSPVTEDELQIAIDSIKFLGLSPLPSKSCYLSDGYLAGPDQQRANDVNAAFLDPTIKGIFCLRGGYGAGRILPLLDYHGISQKVKVFVGYSDITALHTVFNRFCGFITYHGPMPWTGYNKLDDFTINALRSSLFKGFEAGKIENPPNQPIRTLHAGLGQGILTGGNLSVIASTLGSPYDIESRDKILFLEEVDESLYKIDRNLTALRLAGKFDKIKGVMLGTFTHNSNGGKDSYQQSLSKMFYQIFQPYNIPVVENIRCGHSYPQLTLPLGMPVELSVENAEQATISLCV